MSGTQVLVISGPAGVGKSSVAFETSLQLQRDGIEHALIDTDELDHIFPVPADLAVITERNLAAMWRTFSDRGAQRLILVGVYLARPTELEWIGRAVPNARFTLVGLRASEPTLHDRVRQREIGGGMEAQWQRTRQQAVALATEQDSGIHDVVTDDISVTETARRIVALWLRSQG
ncbi:MAG: hypothetical protein H0V12_12750 [Chloroflexi bacterium]|nr:hypothetical protein [Chloroflexota bacterium]